MKMQAALTIGASDPVNVNKKLLMRQALESMDVPEIDKVIPLDDEQKPQDPATENMNIIMGKPVKVFYHQDHEAHIQVHMAAVNDPKLGQILQMSPSAQSVMSSANAHIMEHVAYAYRKQVEQSLGSPLPDPSQPLPPEAEVQMSRPIAQAAAMVQAQNQNEQAQKQAMENAKDPVLVAQMIDAQTKLAKAQLDAQRFELEKRKALADTVKDFAKIESAEDTAAAQMAVQLAVNDANVQQKDRAEAQRAKAAAEKEIAIGDGDGQ